jgi:hypothetical protein
VLTEREFLERALAGDERFRGALLKQKIENFHTMVLTLRNDMIAELGDEIYQWEDNLDRYAIARIIADALSASKDSEAIALLEPDEQKTLLLRALAIAEFCPKPTLTWRAIFPLLR